MNRYGFLASLDVTSVVRLKFETNNSPKKKYKTPIKLLDYCHLGYV